MDPNNPIITLPDGTTAQVQGVATVIKKWVLKIKFFVHLINFISINKFSSTLKMMAFIQCKQLLIQVVMKMFL